MTDRRRMGHRTPARVMLIVVEGRSEKTYFERFRTPESKIAVRIHESGNRTARGMTEKCIGLIERSGLDTETNDVIAVFDADRSSPEEIEEAARSCSENGIQMYISNPSFEFWLLLHFEDNTATYIQDELEKRLEKHIGAKYKKSEGINKHITDENIKKAVVRSKKLLPDGDPCKCKGTVPSTCLHILVERLMK